VKAESCRNAAALHFGAGLIIVGGDALFDTEDDGRGARLSWPPANALPEPERDPRCDSDLLYDVNQICEDVK
jgi:hypothetical protein